MEKERDWEKIEEDVFYTFEEKCNELKVPCHVVRSKDDSRRIYYSATYCDKETAIRNFKKKEL